MKCQPIIETYDYCEGPPKRKKGKLKTRKPYTLSSGRPTDAERTKERFSIKCKVCLRLYKSKPSYDEDQAKHAKFFDLNGTMKCPECKEDVNNIDITDHFNTKHPGKTCCIGCQLVMINQDGALRKHVVKFHHNQNICEHCGRVFNDPRLFEIHVKAVHTDIRDHFCDRCGKVSNDLSIDCSLYNASFEKHAVFLSKCNPEIWKKVLLFFL